MPSELRRAFIAARMAEAGPEHVFVAAGGRHVAQHPSMPLRTELCADGAWLGPGGASPAWGMRMRVDAVGRRGSRQRHVLDTVDPEVDGNRAEYARGAGVTEWYVHGPLGLEHGLTISTRPVGDGALTVEVGLTGLRAKVSGQDVLLVDEAGERRARMTNLYALDAEGRRVSARFAASQRGIQYVVEDRDARYPLVIDPLIITEEMKLMASDAAAHDAFGHAVAISGDIAIVGAEARDTLGFPNAGGAYVFVRTATGWSEQATMEASDAAPNDHFAGAVAISGDTALISAPDYVRPGVGIGCVYVFVRTGAVWSEEAMLSPSEGTTRFGTSVAISDGTALVGSEGSMATNGQGRAYVFAREGTSWSQQAVLGASDATSGDFFSASVSLSADTALVGAPSAVDAERGETGKAYVFVRTGASWSEQAILQASDAEAYDTFGWSVALSGETALVGAGAHSHSGLFRAGSAYVFVRSGTSWSEQAILRASDAAARDGFGGTVGLSGDTALIGASADDHASGALLNAGSVYVFTRSGMSWSEQAVLRASDAAGGNTFGRSLAISGIRAVVGAEVDSHSGLARAGSAYVFALRSGVDGAPCTTSVECESGFCVDGVCCASECGGGEPTDCQACSVAAGASTDGVCLVLPSDVVCRSSDGICDVAERCDGAEVECPPDALAPVGTACRAAAHACDTTEACTGEGVECPPDAELECDDGDSCTADSCAEPDGCRHDPVPGCRDAGAPDAGRRQDAGARVDGGGDAGPDASGVGGCGCRVSAQADRVSFLLGLLFLTATFVRRGRRRRVGLEGS